MKRFWKKYSNQLFLGTGLLLFALLQTYCGPKAVPQEACGFIQNSLGQRISWKQNLPIKMYFDSEFPQQFRPAVQEAISTWEAEVGHPLITIVGEQSGIPAAHDNINIIYWRNSTVDPQVAPAFTKASEQANTTVYWADNQLLEADMVVNGDGFSYSLTPTSLQVDVQSLILHEVGHVLGLKHIDTEPSVMNAKLDAGQIRRGLYQIDATDIKCEY